MKGTQRTRSIDRASNLDRPLKLPHSVLRETYLAEALPTDEEVGRRDTYRTRL
jgi:hypothetical protein